MSTFNTAVVATGLVLGLYFVLLGWLHADLRKSLNANVRGLMALTFGVMPAIAIGVFWSAVAVAIALATAFVIAVLAFICYDSEKRSLDSVASPQWLKLL